MLTSGAYGYMADYIVWWVLLLSLLVHTWTFFKFFPWKRYRKLGLIIGNALILACMLGIVAMAVESHLRFVVVETDAFGVSLPARRWFTLNTRLNSLGCRDVEWTQEKPAGALRIAFVGDSFAYGWGIERVEDRFTDRLAAMFERRSPQTVEVMNVAKPGWGTGDQIEPVRRLIARYGIDEVVLCYVPNDIEKLLPTTGDFNPTRPPEPTFFNPDSSCLLDYLYRRIYLPRVPTIRDYHDWLAEGFADKEIWSRHQRQLHAIISHCREHDVTIRALLLPFLRTRGEKYEANQLHAVLRSYFEVHKVPLVDLLEVLSLWEPKDLVVNARDPHPNKRAHELVADAIWRAFYAETDPAQET